MDRAAFLAKVREAARAGQAHRVHTKELPADVGYVGDGDDPAARLAAEIEAVGGHAHRVADVAAGRRELISILEEKGPASALCWEHPVLEDIGLGELLQSSNVKAISYQHLADLPHEEQRQAMLAADIGISAADYTVAETGTVAVASACGRERSVTLLPPVLVTVVEGSQIVPDLFDLFENLGELPSNLSLITGPSKTGDIELQLTTGVHGPGEWHVIIVE